MSCFFASQNVICQSDYRYGAGDVVKTRMQLAEKKKDDAEPAKNALAVAKEMIREEGAGSLYGGLSAAMARQAVSRTLSIVHSLDTRCLRHYQLSTTILNLLIN
jgi:Mitochondrial carrier protein